MIHPRSADDLISEDDFNQDERLPYWARSLAVSLRVGRRAGRKAVSAW